MAFNLKGWFTDEGNTPKKAAADGTIAMDAANISSIKVEKSSEAALEMAAQKDAPTPPSAPPTLPGSSDGFWNAAPTPQPAVEAPVTPALRSTLDVSPPAPAAAPSDTIAVETPADQGVAIEINRTPTEENLADMSGSEKTEAPTEAQPIDLQLSGPTAIVDNAVSAPADAEDAATLNAGEIESLIETPTAEPVAEAPQTPERPPVEVITGKGVAEAPHEEAPLSTPELEPSELAQALSESHDHTDSPDLKVVEGGLPEEKHEESAAAEANVAAAKATEEYTSTMREFEELEAAAKLKVLEGLEAQRHLDLIAAKKETLQKQHEDYKKKEEIAAKALAEEREAADVFRKSIEASRDQIAA